MEESDYQFIEENYPDLNPYEYDDIRVLEDGSLNIQVGEVTVNLSKDSFLEYDGVTDEFSSAYAAIEYMNEILGV